MEPSAVFHPDTRVRWRAVVAALTAVVLTMAMLGSTVGVADAQAEDRASRDTPVQIRDTPVQDVETLRLACHVDSIEGQRGVLCVWSAATNPATRGYQLYRIVDDSARELLTTVRVDGRLGYFDTDLSAPSSLVYGVISLNRAGRLIGRSAPAHVQIGQDVQALRLACGADSIDGHRGVLCRWSATTQPSARGYLVYRLVGDGPREVIAQIGLDGRHAHFDRNVTPGVVYTYAVVAVDGDGTVVAQGGPRHVRWPAAD